MLGLTFKESGSSLDDIISALTVELENLAGRSFDDQASGNAAVAGKCRSRGRAEPRLQRRRLPPGRKALPASRIEQSIANAGPGRPRYRQGQRSGWYGKGRPPSRAASSVLGQAESDAEASAAIESLIANLTRACEAAGFEVTGSSRSAGTGKALSRAV